MVFAAAAQLLTAAMTRFVLGKRLLRGQQLAVGCPREVTADATNLSAYLALIAGALYFEDSNNTSCWANGQQPTVIWKACHDCCRRLHQVGLVCLGICLRGAAFRSSASAAKGSVTSGAAAGQTWGLAAMLTSALGYSLLGVLYDLLLSTEAPPPTHAEVMQYTSKLGVLTSHFVLTALPNCSDLLSAVVHHRDR